jgi:NACHT domain-containing protein
MREWLESLPEIETYDLLRNLLIAMGFDRVAVTHGTNEYGRDLVFRERDRLGREIWRGLQVKADSPSGSLRSERGLRAILTQCDAALKIPYVTPAGEKVTLKEQWLVLTKPLKESAKNSAEGRLKGAGIEVIDGAHLVDLVTQFLPELVRLRTEPIDQYLMTVVEMSESVNPYLSAKLGADIRLGDIYLPPLACLALLKQEAVGYLEARRLRIDLQFVHNLIDEVAYLSQAGLLPAAYHYRVASAASRITEIIEAVKSFTWFSDVAEDADAIPAGMISAVSIGQKLPFNDGGLTREHLRAIFEDLKRIDRPELAPLRDRKRGRGRQNYPSSADSLQNQERSEALLAELATAYNTAIEATSALMPVIPDVARLLFEHAGRGGTVTIPRRNKSREKEVKTSLQAALKRWGDYAEKLVEALALHLSSILRDVASSTARLSAKSPLLQEDLRILAEARILTEFVVEHFDLPEDAISNREIDAEWLCMHAPLLVVEGDLGSGKTTLLHRVAGECARGHRRQTGSRIPVLITLARVSDEAGEPVASRLLGAAHRDLACTLTNIENVRIFLDGFDEIRSEECRREIVDWIEGLGSTAEVVVSSRPFALHDRIPTGLRVALLPFKDDQVASFVKKFPWRDASSAPRLMQVLGREKELNELARSPLLLTLICLLAQARGAEQLPTRRESVYHLVLELLLTEWDLSKGIQRERVVEDESLRRAVLERTAYGLYALGRRYFSKEEFVDVLIAAYPRGGAPLDLGLMFFADVVRDCIIVPAGQGQFGFLHYSVQEYLAALELARDVDLTRVFQILRAFLEQRRWEEVLVFYAGIKRDIAPFLTSIHECEGEFFENTGQPRPDFVRLIRRMLEAADFTKTEALSVRGAVAAAFAEIGVGGLKERWLKTQWLPGGTLVK